MVRINGMSSAYSLVSLLILITSPVSAQNSQISESTHLPLNVTEYLSRYGYFEEIARTSLMGDQGDTNEIKALKLFQRRNNLNPTGEVDDATERLMESDRCGMSDFETTNERILRIIRKRTRQRQRIYRQASQPFQHYVLSGHKWNKQEITYRIYNSPSNPSDVISNSALTLIVAEAMQAWENATLLTFKEIADAADINIRFFRSADHADVHPEKTFSQKDYAHAFSPNPATVDTLGGDIHFNDYVRWTKKKRVRHERGNKERSILFVTMHELGHSLGLGHSALENSIMQEKYNKYTGMPKLSTDDINAIRKLYVDESTGLFQKITPTITAATRTRVAPEEAALAEDISRSATIRPQPFEYIPWETSRRLTGHCTVVSLEEGTRIFVNGTVTPDAAWFVIELKAMKRGADIAALISLHMAVVLNVQNSGSSEAILTSRDSYGRWAANTVHRNVAIFKHQSFAVEIVYRPASYTINVNGHFFAQITHKFPVTELDYVEIRGDLSSSYCRVMRRLQR